MLKEIEGSDWGQAFGEPGSENAQEIRPVLGFAGSTKSFSREDSGWPLVFRGRLVRLHGLGLSISDLCLRGGDLQRTRKVGVGSVRTRAMGRSKMVGESRLVRACTGAGRTSQS